MTRTTSQLRTPALDELSATSCEDAGSHENSSVHAFGEIISIRPNAPLQTTEALRESEARLRALLSSLDDLVFELDENGVYLAIWTTDEALLAAPRSEMLGRTLRETIGEEIGLRLTRVIGHVLE